MKDLVKQIWHKYQLFIKFSISSFLSFLSDIAVFYLVDRLLRFFIADLDLIITIATIVARIVSTVVNYAINRKKVFAFKDSLWSSFVKFGILAVVKLSASAYLVTLFTKITGIDETFVKIVVDFVLFFFAFLMQRIWVFRNRKDHSK